MRYNWHTITTDYTQQLSAFAASIQYDNIPPQVREAAKRLLLHTVGAALAAKDTAEAKRIAALAEASNGGPGGAAAGWAARTPLSPAAAALENGALASLLSWEDEFRAGAAAAIIPAAWAVAQAQHRSGKDLLAAIVAAHEVSLRIAHAVWPSPQRQRDRGLGLNSWQVFGAAIAGAKLLGLDADQLNQAIGMATCCSVIPADLSQRALSSFACYEQGLRARDGVIIADLVSQGIQSLMDGLDDKAAYAVHMTDAEDETWYVRDCGTLWLTEQALVKRWPVSQRCQAPVELALALADQHRLDPCEIASIVVDTVWSDSMAYPPEGGFPSLMRAKHSLPFVLATALCHHEPGADWYSKQSLSDPLVLGLAGRVRGGKASEPFPAQPCEKLPALTVTIKMADGREFSQTTDDPLLDLAFAMTQEQSFRRFRLQAESALDDGLEGAFQVLRSIERCEDIAALGEF